MPVVFYLCVIAFLGGFVQGMTGFGVMLLALPLMAFFINIKTAVTLILMLGMVINAILIGQLFRHISAQKWLPLFLFSLPGIPVGVLILKYFSASAIEIVVGAVVIATSAFNIWHKSTPARIGKGWAAVAGFAAGCLGGSIGAAGPPAIMYTSLQPWTKEEIKATITMFFICESVLIVLFHALNGFVTREVLFSFGWCVLPLAAGVATGISAFNRVNETLYRKIVHGLLLMLGIMLLCK